jgi:phage FluMu protein Com
MTHVAHTTVYLYSNNMVGGEHDHSDPSSNLRCIRCGKLLAKANGQILILANTQSSGLDEIPPNLPAFELKCPGCNMVMSVLWQAM